MGWACGGEMEGGGTATRNCCIAPAPCWNCLLSVISPAMFFICGIMFLEKWASRAAAGAHTFAGFVELLDGAHRGGQRVNLDADYNVCSAGVWIIVSKLQKRLTMAFGGWRIGTAVKKTSTSLRFVNSAQRSAPPSSILSRHAYRCYPLRSLC